MKIVRINKKYTGGIIEHFLILDDEPYSNDDIEYLVENWCEREICGKSNGYSYEWWFVEDEKIITSILEKKIELIKNQLEELQTKKYKIEKYLKL